MLHLRISLIPREISSQDIDVGEIKVFITFRLGTNIRNYLKIPITSFLIAND